MNALRTLFNASSKRNASAKTPRALRFSSFLCLLALLAGLMPPGVQAAPAAGQGGLGQALSLMASMHASQVRAAAPSGDFSGAERTPNGRVLLGRDMMRPGALRAHATSSNTVPIPGAEQTFDVNNPAPAFQPLIGFQNADGSLGNNPANAPIFQPLNALIPTNLTPIWSADEKFLIFSSNRSLNGDVNHEGIDGITSRFHLWAISVNGGEAFQITTSQATMGENTAVPHGEFFPTLTPTDGSLAFTSDAQSSGTQNLFVLSSFSFSALLTLNNSQAFQNVSNIDTANGGILSVTLRAPAGQTTFPTEAQSAALTGFDAVQRPTFLGTNAGELVFSARSVTGPNAFHNHLYFLFTSSGGSDANNISFPGQLTDGPADDTDPASSKDGQFVAFASTATSLTPNGAGGGVPTLTSGGTTGGNRTIFLVGGGGTSGNGLGVVPASFQTQGGRVGAITAVGTDNFGPAWSFNNPNQFTNPSPGFEYLAFARGASQTATHDIVYIQAVRFLNAGGGSQRSIEAGTTPRTFNFPVYQINAGDLSGGGVGGYLADNNNLFNNGQGFFSPFLPGVTETVNPPNVPSTAGDPGTPVGIFLTDRNGPMNYALPNLTAGATYTLRLHFSDPTNTAAGQRQFNVVANGQQILTNFDIVANALGGPGNFGGLVTSGGNAQPGVTVTVTNAAGNVLRTLTTGVPQTFAPPNGDGAPTNYFSNLPSGTYTVTASGAGFTAQSQTIVVNSAGFTRANFNVVSGTTATAVGNVTNAVTTAPAPNVPIRVTDPVTTALIASGTTDANGNYNFPVPNGTFNITANPATATGLATQTQTATFTANTPTTTNFALAGGNTVGTLSGNATDMASGQPLTGVTITIVGAGYRAIVNTANGQPNFSVNLPGAVTPGTQYTVTFSLPGYTTVQATPSIINGSVTNLNQVLVRANGGQPNAAVVQTFNVTVPARTFRDNFGNTDLANNITLNFTNSVPVAKGVPIIQGIEVLAGANVNGTRTASSGFGNLTTATDPSAPQNLLAIGDFNGGSGPGFGSVTLTFNTPGGVGGSLGTPTSFSVFRSAGSPTQLNSPGTGAGQEGAFAYLLNQVPTNNGGLLTLVDTQATIGNEYFYFVTANFQEQIVPEGDTPTGASAANAVVRLNTDDNSGETTAGSNGTGGQQEGAQTGNTFDDVYPAWSPGLSIFSITYQGGGFNFATGAVTNSRTVTYNDPSSSFPSETAISVAPGGVVNTSSTSQPTYSVVGPTPRFGVLGYTGIFESQVLNLDPPTLLRYNPNEIIHVQAGNSATPISGVSEKVGIAPGQKVTFTVRLSDREAGIDNGTNSDGTPRAPLNNGPTSTVNVGGTTLPSRSQVFLQIKNPNSKYQDSQNLEHKVFSKDSQYNNQPNRFTSNDTDSGTANSSLGLGFLGYEGPPNGIITNNKYQYPPFGGITQLPSIVGRDVFPRGAHGGQWTFPDANNPDDTYIFVGKAGGGINPGGETGGDPALFIPRGPEYECQLVNPQFLTSGNPNSGIGDVSPADFRNPFWLAGVDDQAAFSGVNKVRPIAQNGTAPAEWLQMVPSPVQDNRGGVLYTVTWTTPASASDFFLDVVAYDQAVFPNIPVGTSNYVGKQVNWRIYDNTGGFSTVQNLSSANSILVVSDYALGQKFAATTFAGRDSNLNLVPKLFGAESYLTDVDISTLADVNYAGLAVGTVNPPSPTLVQPFLYDPTLFNWTSFGTFFGTTITTQNGLGVGSYYDTIIDDGERRDGAPDLPTQRYTIWRTLARGPVTDAVLASYLPLRETQPAINDPVDPAFANIPAATILNAPRCVIWLSPYTGDLLTDPGSLNDPGTPAQNGSVARPSTQTVLRNFVLGDGTAAHPGGGRLFMTGQDVGATLTINGTSGNTAGGFLPDVLSAKEVTPGGGSTTLAATANRITGSPFYDNTSAGRYLTVIGNFTTGFFIVNLQNLPYQDNLILGNVDRNDAALDQIPALTLATGASIQGRIDTIAPTNGATVAATYGAGGPVAMVFHDDPFQNITQTGTPNSGTGSRTVYAAFGIESLSSDYYASVAPIPPDPPRVPPPVIPRDPRQAILHNIICYLRTASVTGIITQTAGPGVAAGTPVAGVTVYLRPTGGAPPTRAAFSASTGGDGRFTIDGIEPGTYTLVAYKSGFQRTIGNNGTAFTLEGGVVRNNGTLTITALNPGSIAGTVKDTAGNGLIGASVTFTSTDKTTTETTTTRTGLQAGQPAGSYFVDSVPVATYTSVANGPTNDQGTFEYTTAAAPDAPFNAGVSVLSNATTQPVNFTLTPILATVSGRVTSSTGTALAGATVTLTGPTVGATAPTVLTTTTAADGTYTFTNVPAASTALSATPVTGIPYTITATASGFGAGAAPGPVTLELGDVVTDTTAPAHRTDVVLTALASISGRIFDNTVGDTNAGGANVAGATVTLTNAAGTVVATTSASATGTYTFTNVPSTTTPTTYTVTATRVGFTTNSSAPFTVVLGSVITAKDIGLTPIAPGSITGRVTDTANGGAGVGGALVTFVSADGTTTLHATADGSGNYSLPTVFPGTYNGTATGPLNPNGRPTTTQGTATAVVASAPAVATANFSVATIPPSLAGTVTDSATPTHNPLKNALVTITDTASGTVIQTLHTDANGKYSTGPLPASGKPLSQYTVTITASLVGFATQSLPSQSIYNGDALTDTIASEAPLLDIALVAAGAGSVSGQVTDVSTGAGVSGAVVSFLSTDGTTTLPSATTDANGNYSIPTTGKTDPSGNYIGSVTPPNNANGRPEFTTPPTQNITIPAGGTQTVNFTLTEILAALSGTVLDNQTGTPISGATVTLTDATGKAIGTPQTTGATGTFSFAAIPAGQAPAAFALSATVPGGYFPGAKTVTLSLGDLLTGQNIGLDEKGTITGLVTDGSTGQPLPNVSLTVTDTTTKATPTNLTPSPLVTTPGTAIGPDGKTSNYTATFTLTPGHSYTVSASKPNYNPTAPVAVTPSPLTASQAGRADLQLTSGIGTLGGLVSDATTNAAIGGATVTVASVSATGASTVVATFTTNSSVSPAPDGKTQGINYSGQVAQGTYTVTLAFGSRTPVVQKVTVVGGQFNRLDFTGANGAPPVYVFPAGLNFLSTPYDYSSLSFDTLFGILNTAPTGTTPNGNRTHVAVWDPTVSQYAVDPNAPADSLRLGVGYWVFLKNAVPLTVQGATPSAAFVPVALHPSWNQIGVPNIKGVPVSSLMFDNGAGGMISFATAASSQYHVVAPTLYSFDGSGYQPVTQSSVLQPWKAYWIQVYSGATLEIPTK